MRHAIQYNMYIHTDVIQYIQYNSYTRNLHTDAIQYNTIHTYAHIYDTHTHNT